LGDAAALAPPPRRAPKLAAARHAARHGGATQRPAHPIAMAARARSAPHPGAPRGAAPSPPRRSLLLLLLVALLLPAAFAKAPTGSSAHRAEHAARVRGKKHAASRRARSSSATAGGASSASSASAALLEATGGMCNFMETEPFEEYFQTDLNATRWDLDSMEGLFHCNRGTDEYVRRPVCVFACALRAPLRPAAWRARRATVHVCAGAGSQRRRAARSAQR
jgi:hypothetical protein